MNRCSPTVGLDALRRALAGIDPALDASQALELLVEADFDCLPTPGRGATLERWQVLSLVAQHDLSLAKLFEGHTDALAILDEIDHAATADGRGTTKIWGVWAAEAPDGKALIREGAIGDQVLLTGAKCWCSGAATATHGLLTAWVADEVRPQLVSVLIRQPGVHVDSTAWKAVGMAGSASVDITFDGAVAQRVGDPGQYLARPGFWQGGAGVAACWYGGAVALGGALMDSLHRGVPGASSDFRMAAFGKVDLELRSTAAVLREVARWIDDNPCANARAPALRARLAAERCAHVVLDEVGRALGAAPFCRDARFARLAADLPVFVRQSHAERDFAALGETVLGEAAAISGGDPWTL